MPGAAGMLLSLRVPRTMTSSKMPWYAPVKIAMRFRPVTVRAMRIVPITASEPVLQNAARSAPVRSQNSSATSPASTCWGPISKPFSTWSWIASRMKSACQPNRLMPNPESTSTYSFPSRSHIRLPRERSMTIW